VPVDSILSVRRSIFIKAPPERVWREFESREAMARWWGVLREPPEIGKPNGMELVSYEPRTGAMLEMRIENADGLWRFGGVITVFDPPRELTFENDWIEPSEGWLKPTYITLRLTAALDGTIVELYHHGFERTGGDAGATHAGYESGWGMLQLDTLRALVEGASS
jgi:uncharacterized protein YndB with AHSA1/START domain